MWKLASIVFLPLTLWGALQIQAVSEDLLQQADKAYAEKTYSKALVLYQQAEASGKFSRRADHVGLRIGLCLGRLKRFQQADERFTRLARSRPETRTAARALVERGVMRLTKPTYYYEKDGKKHWGEWVQGGTYHWVARDSLRTGLTSLEEAGRLLERLVAAPGPASTKETVARRALHRRCFLEWAAAIERGRNQNGNDVPRDKVIENDPYGRLTTWNERLAWTFERALAVQKKAGDPDGMALTGYLQGMAFRRLLRRLSHLAVKEDGIFRYRPDPRQERLVALPEAWNPIKILQRTLAAAKGRPLADDLLYALASVQQENRFFVDAVANFKKLLDQFPKSGWRDDAQYQIEQITFPRLSMEAGSSHPAGRPLKVVLKSRNLPRVQVKAWRFPRRWILENDRLLKDARKTLSSTEEIMARLRVSPHAEGVAASIDHATPDRKRHAWHEETLELRGLQPGAYLIEASGGGVVYRDLVYVSKLALIRQVDGDRTLLFVTDAETGKPVAGAEVLVRERIWGRWTFGRGWKVKNSRGRTRADGTWAAPRFMPERSGSSYVEAAAWTGDQTAAVRQASYWRRNRNRAGSRAYVISDRPVYRPGHTINFTAIVRREQGGTYENLPSEKVLVKIRDPRGTTVFEQTLQTDATGSLGQKLVLGAEPALGAYRVSIMQGRRTLGSGSIRVEEYKKPEFEVSVAPPSTQARIGSAVSATLEGRYYFGAPVAGAKVAYRVFRERWWPAFRRRQPFRHLYGSIPGNVDPSDRGRGRELVLNGEGVLDARGRLVIEWKAEPQVVREKVVDSVYIVQADVTDSSRRTISGSSRIPVTRTAFQTQLVADRGFYVRGEQVALEIQTQAPSGAAVATQGRFRVFRVRTRLEGQKRVESLTQILDQQAATDERGMGFVRWTADEGGRFVLSYQAKDAWGEVVRTDIPLWVQAADFQARDFELRNLRLRTDKRVYRRGETVRLLVTGNFADSAVLLCMVAGARTLEHRVVQLDGKVKLVEIPVTKAMTPNVHLQAWSVRYGGFYEAHHEILVPPVESLLDVSLAFDKDTYKPGEKGRATVTVKDDKGRPVAARVALTAFDASVLYIQQDQSVDIRRFFHGNRRGRNTIAGASHKFGFSGYKADDVSWGEYERRGPPPAWWNQSPGLASRLLAGMGFGRAAELASKGRKLGEGYVKDFDLGDDDGVRAPAKKSRRGRASGGGRLPATAARPARSPPSEGAFSKDEAVEEEGLDREEDKSRSQAGEPSGGSAGVKVRTDFRDTAVWAPDVLCGPDGTAVVEVPFPESLTRWRAKAVAWTADTRVGQTTADATTTKDLLVRLQAPRFFLEGDRIIVAAVVNNRTGEDQECEVELTASGDTLRTKESLARKVRVPAHGDARVDWWMEVLGDGEAQITVKAKSASDADAMRLGFPVMVWGAEKTLTATGILDGDAQRSLSFELPAERSVNTSSMEVTVQPSLAATMLDALPYLISYPYGCVEQTTSRFIPAVATALTLKEMGTSLEEIASNRRALPQAAQLAMHAPVDDRRLRRIVEAGLQRLAGMQNSNGGFGWWKSDSSSVYLTAYVLDGLKIALDAGEKVPESMVKRALAWLVKAAPKADRIHAATYAALVLSRFGKAPQGLLTKIFENRDELTPYGRALLASALVRADQGKRARVAIGNLADTAREDTAAGTVHWSSSGRAWWWWNSSIETNAAILQALLDVQPTSPWLRPLVKWLVTNRKGNRWRNTRDTALCVLALCRYAKVSGELDPDYELVLSMNGSKKTFRVNRKNMFAFDNTFTLKGDALVTGENELKIQQAGRGRAYVTARTTFFTKEADIKGAGHEILVQRRYYRIEERSVETVENGKKVRRLETKRIPMVSGAPLAAGTIVEVELEIDARNDFEYLLFEDMKPAGFEPLQLRSGRSYKRGICSNTEFRDERTAFFVTWLQQGKHKLSYRLRAEIPGTLRALPARGGCMYSPEYGGISDSFRIEVQEARGQ